MSSRRPESTSRSLVLVGVVVIALAAMVWIGTSITGGSPPAGRFALLGSLGLPAGIVCIVVGVAMSLRSRDR